MGTAPFRSYFALGMGGWLAGIPIAASAGDWTITPRVGVQELYTDNVLLTRTDRRSDFVTTLSPGLAIGGESARLQGTLDYAPTIYLYALTPGQNTIGQNLYANGTATLLPEKFFLDARGYAALQPTTPGLGTNSPFFFPNGLSNATATPNIPTTQLTQITSFNASPHVVWRFDGWGSSDLRYTLSDTNFSGGRNPLLSPPGTATQNGNSITNEGTASFTTGENFGRFASRLSLDAAQSSGAAVLVNSSQNRATVESQYAVTHAIAALATIGYEDIRFGGVPPTRIDDVVWGLGVRLTRAPDAALTLRYEHLQGVTTPYILLNYAPTARTRIAASYSESLSTYGQEVENNLAVSDLNSVGQTIDRRTQFPFLISNPIFGLQNGLFRIKRLTGTGYVDRERDHLLLSAYREEDRVVAQLTPGSGTSERATGVNLSWARELSRLTSATLGIGYASLSFLPPQNVHEGIFTSNASVSYLLTDTLNCSANYYFFDRTAEPRQFKLTANIFFISVRKIF